MIGPGHINQHGRRNDPSKIDWLLPIDSRHLPKETIGIPSSIWRKGRLPNKDRMERSSLHQCPLAAYRIPICIISFAVRSGVKFYFYISIIVPEALITWILDMGLASLG